MNVPTSRLHRQFRDGCWCLEGYEAKPKAGKDIKCTAPYWVRPGMKGKERNSNITLGTAGQGSTGNQMQDSAAARAGPGTKVNPMQGSALGREGKEIRRKPGRNPGQGRAGQGRNQMQASAASGGEGKEIKGKTGPNPGQGRNRMQRSAGQQGKWGYVAKERDVSHAG
ncbi:unnamed protein product [Calypogeia fissa]